ncbi:transposase [uncultured Nitratireductor sp.]|uniref:transposase n=1 Tax=uncultured Nitratireductor sp. TaxID=520953 RepID=UPI0025D97514|nr:transposase [uncultured Nitratireductor sp.]
MPRTRNPYPAEFRQQIIALAKAGRSVESLAREFEPCVATIHGWVKQAEIDGGTRDDGLTSAEREELGARARRTGSFARSATFSQRPQPGLQRTT